MLKDTKGADILRKARLDALKIYCYSWGQGHFHEILLEGLCPNHDLRKFKIDGYEGTTLPSWALMMGTYLPQLVTIKLWGLRKLQHLPSLSELCHLKSLQLFFMDDIEYIEGPFMLASRSAELMTFFPSLEKLCLFDMPKLKGWWRDLVLVEADAATVDSFIDGNGRREQVVIPSFPRLHELEIDGCPSMTYFPPCPVAKKVELSRCNEALTFCMKEGVPSAVIIASSSSSSSNLLPISVSDTSNSGDLILFERLKIDDAGILNSLLQEFGRGAVAISIVNSKMDSFSVCKLGFQRYCASSLRELSIYKCWKLKSLSEGGIEHLTNLQHLYIDDCYLLDLEEKENMPWKSLHSLSSLTLRNLPKLVNLPEGLQYVTTLLSLRINSCKNLKVLPQWFYLLCSLESLQLLRCSELKSLPEVLRRMNSLTELVIYCCNNELSDRCREPDGEDCPKIRHISEIHIC
ncbi:putative disease resistance protein RGA3 [Beta vulgaris subsp. vulgaris]|uniref:putative disease resistance protein RGA3 n=1 Tax=Beta vulgaris subsp. vulgaris TaxID=3555 RepID=UPI002036D0EB|nr:putative disease resistance protein RGA3 [Beta vulgaris subsp. vulgaris]